METRIYDSKPQKRLWRVITRANIPRKVLAAELGVSEATISRWAAGEMRMGEDDVRELVLYLRTEERQDVADEVVAEYLSGLTGLGYRLTVDAEEAVPGESSVVGAVLSAGAAAGQAAQEAERALVDGAVSLEEAEGLRIQGLAVQATGRRIVQAATAAIDRAERRPVELAHVRGGAR